MARGKLEVSYKLICTSVLYLGTLSTFLGLNFCHHKVPFAIDALSDFIFLGNL